MSRLPSVLKYAADDSDDLDGFKSSSGSDTSDGSDSDDSSEMDLEECDRRRTECIDHLADIEKQFLQLREQLYRERMNQVNTKLKEVREGTAAEYREPLEELQDNLRVSIEVAGILRELRLEIINNSYQAEDLAARQNIENEKQLLYDFMKDQLEDKIRRLEEEMQNPDIQSDVWASEKPFSTRDSIVGPSKKIPKKGKHSDISRHKPITVTGPFIVYMLTEAEILEDWAVIKKSLSSTQRRNSDIHYR